jgi:hypothetical protein
MTFDAHRAAIVAHFEDNWRKPDDVAPLFPVEFENRPIPAQSGTWCRLAVRFGERDNASVGTEHQRTVGILFLQVFVKEGQGTGDARKAANRMAESFDNVQLPVGNPATGWITFRPANFTTVGKTGDGWYQYNITAQFTADAYHDQQPDEIIIEGEMIL